ncbi:hypothetical protein HELRODRAFT_103179 [Helobdella robusta]|uniref:Aspartate dehydrogenase domain-containing protein n=1 Tax=Helobdella robusta TaxID=6412 RepID=T1EDE8_HELRO|nr:hypothetical protein HELRODRAFT_103179 [Helobdella robusta]ESN93832.1 hypothetical protein HELRODRAFT_103179 [Helobdella robusta]
MSSKQRIGVLGCGVLGQFLIDNMLKEDSLEVIFLWDIDQARLKELSTKYPNILLLESLENLQQLGPDLIVEVAHPDVTRNYGFQILEICDYLMGSPSALADEQLYEKLSSATTQHSLYIPSGAFWGGEDIRKMADLKTLEKLKVTMTFHPASLKLVAGDVRDKNDKVTNERTILYDGPVRCVCKQAPNNVNTMAAAAIAGHNLGFDGVLGCLISDPNLDDRHIVEIEVWGKPDVSTGGQFHVRTVRSNPALFGQVTGTATLPAFFGSLLGARGKKPGIHLC